MTREQYKSPKTETAAGGEPRLERELQSQDEQIPSMIGYWDRGLLNRFGNRAYAQWFGVDPEKMPGMHIRDVIGEERYSVNLPYIEAALRGEEQQFERIIPVPGGKTPRIALAQYVPDVFNGEVQGFYALVSDITVKKKTEAILREKQDQLQGLYELSTLGIAMADLSGRFIDFNEAFCKICGYSAEELKALDYWKLTPEKYLVSEPAQMETLIRTGRYGPYEKEYIRKDGSLVSVSLTGVMITGSDDQRYIWSIVEDITERKQTMERLQLFEQCISRANDVILITEAEPIDLPGNRIVFVNDAFERTTGYSREEALGNTPRMSQGPKTDRATLDRIRLALSRWQPVREEVLNYTKSGQEFWIDLAIAPIANDAGWFTHWISIQRDITERKLAEQRVKNLAYFDTLTGLPNRQLLQDRLQDALLSSVRQKQFGALLLVDLDNFKVLNDTLGHEQGDLLLQQVAVRLKECVGDSDTVARLGSDEFIVMLEGLGDSALQASTQAAMLSENILRRLGEHYELGDWAHGSTASLGITLFGEQAESVDSPMVRADLAMHKAKDAGRNTLCFFDSQMQIDMVNTVVLEEDLRQALRSQQFHVYYQAQVAGEKKIVGVEALLRWQHPLRGWVSPVEFIPKAEKTGLILPLGLWVMETACRQLALWALRPETAQLTIAVNVSARQFRDSDFVDRVLAALLRTGAKAHLLKIELTESVLVANVEDVTRKMNTLKSAGIRFSLDDFGTGYSSLSVLKRLPLDQLKIDQSFVRNILVDPGDAAIARMVIALASSLDLAVIAEGVETEAQRDCLAAMGCPTYQGYLFSRPVPVAEFEALLAQAQT
ncbi:MAG: EAL domain-containing protein [Comamonadaceae bacterium]|nr:MAG: EAL domain-containing protein [Comamonadaceae bacterium]